MYNSNNVKIRISVIYKIFDKLNIAGDNRLNFISFLLKIEFFYFLENNKKIEWNKLINPESKLSLIQMGDLNRKYFQFHPIIDYLIRHHY